MTNPVISIYARKWLCIIVASCKIVANLARFSDLPLTDDKSLPVNEEGGFDSIVSESV